MEVLGREERRRIFVAQVHDALDSRTTKSLHFFGAGLCADEMLSPPPLSLSCATNTDVPALCLAVPELLPVQVFRPALSHINTTDIHLFTLAVLLIPRRHHFSPLLVAYTRRYSPTSIPLNPAKHEPQYEFKNVIDIRSRTPPKDRGHEPEDVL